MDKAISVDDLGILRNPAPFSVGDYELVRSCMSATLNVAMTRLIAASLYKLRICFRASVGVLSQK